MIPEEEGRRQRLLLKHGVKFASGTLYLRLFSHRSPACGTRIQIDYCSIGWEGKENVWEV
jgi:hypothetical protein